MRTSGAGRKELFPPVPKKFGRRRFRMAIRRSPQCSVLSPGKKHLTSTRLPTRSLRQLARSPSISARCIGIEGSFRISPGRSSRWISIVRMPVSRNQSTGQSAVSLNSGTRLGDHRFNVIHRDPFRRWTIKWIQYDNWMRLRS